MDSFRAPLDRRIKSEVSGVPPKSDPPCVSVVMGTYNVAPYIGEAVRSALEQTFRDFELIVVDDGSTDSTIEIIQNFRDPRLRILPFPHAGVAAALNRGIAAARGEYLAFLDGDDRWRPEKLARHIRFLEEHPEIDLTFAWSRIIDDRGGDTGVRTKRCEGILSFPALLADYSIGTNSSVVVRRHALGRDIVFDDVISGRCFDVDVWLRVARLRPGNVTCLPELLTDYRRRPGQLTGDLDAMERSWYQLLARMQQMAPEDSAGVARRARSNIARYLAMIAYENGQLHRSLAYVRRGWCESPGIFLADNRNWKMMIALAAAFLLPASWNRRARKAAAGIRRRKA